MINIQNSPIENISFNNFNFLIKRDDLLHIDFSGNKARKFQYFLDNDFPNISTVISYGSNQSNAMYSLSVLCKLKNWNFIYYTNHIPSFIKINPIGNYKYALENNMKIIEGEYDKLNIKYDSNNTLFVKEGGAIKQSAYGIKILANEIQEYILKNNLHDIKIFLPSGTGTTALYLQKNLNCDVLTCACVGNDEYLKKQFFELDKNSENHPIILKTVKKFHFGKLYKENYNLYKELLSQTKIQFDLLYDPIGLNTLFYHQDNIDINNILYIHQGGIKGNETMIERYSRKYEI